MNELSHPNSSNENDLPYLQKPAARTSTEEPLDIAKWFWAQSPGHGQPAGAVHGAKNMPVSLVKSHAFTSHPLCCFAYVSALEHTRLNRRSPAAAVRVPLVHVVDIHNHSSIHGLCIQGTDSSSRAMGFWDLRWGLRCLPGVFLLRGVFRMLTWGIPVAGFLLLHPVVFLYRPQGHQVGCFSFQAVHVVTWNVCTQMAW